MQKLIGTTEIEPLAMGILQIALSFGFEALRYNASTCIKFLVGFFSARALHNESTNSKKLYAK